MAPSLPAPAARREQLVGLAAAALAAGYFLFGLVLGSLTGFSTAQGISTTLLTSLFTFVGGALLTFTSLRVAAGSEATVHVDPLRLGVALITLSTGLAIGAPLGVMQRCHVDFQSFLRGEDVPTSPCSSSAAGPTRASAEGGGEGEPPSTEGASLHAGPSRKACDIEKGRLQVALRDPAAPGEVSLERLLSACAQLPADCRHEVDALEAQLKGPANDPSESRRMFDALVKRCRF